MLAARYRKNKVKKTFRLSQELIDRARNALGVRSETEAIEVALDEVVFGEEVVRVLRQYAGRLDIRRPF